MRKVKNTREKGMMYLKSSHPKMPTIELKPGAEHKFGNEAEYRHYMKGVAALKSLGLELLGEKKKGKEDKAPPAPPADSNPPANDGDDKEEDDKDSEESKPLSKMNVAELTAALLEKGHSEEELKDKKKADLLEMMKAE